MNVGATSYLAAAYQTASLTSGNYSLSGSYFEVTGGTSSTGAKDGASISDAAKKLLDRAKELDIFKVIFPNEDVRKDTKSLDEVEDDFTNDFSKFSDSFGSLLSMMGLGDSQPFTMGLNGQGGMTVNGADASSASKLQNFFNNSSNNVLVSRFAVMAARASLVDARSTVDGFDQAYSQDPIQAIKNNIAALKERLLGFKTEADSGNMNYGFVRSFSMRLEFSALTAPYSTGKNGENDAAAEPEDATQVADAEAAAETPEVA